MMPDGQIVQIQKKLEEHEERIRKLETLLQTEKEDARARSQPLVEAGSQKLSREAGITEEQLRYVFDFEEEDLNLIQPVHGQNEREKQFRASICILTGYHYCYGRDQIRSEELRKKLEWLGLKSLTNLSTNLSRYKMFIVPKGQPRSPTYGYKITLPGIKRAIETIKELAAGERSGNDEQDHR